MKKLKPKLTANPLQPLSDLVATQEDWLIKRIAQSLGQNGQLTSTGGQAAAWLLVNPFSQALMAAIRQETILFAEKEGFIPYFQCLPRVLLEYRQIYLDLLDLGNFETCQKKQFQQFVKGFFEQLETLQTNHRRLKQTSQTSEIAIADSSLHSLTRQPTTLTQNSDTVTRRQQTKKALISADAPMPSLLATFSDLWFRIDAQGTILDYKTNQSSLLNFPASELVGKQVQSLLPNAVGKKLYQSIKQALQTQTIVSLEYSLSFSPAPEYFEARIAPFQDQETITFIRNITDRKTTELALRQSEERLSTIIHTNADGLVVIDVQGRVLFVNPAAETLFGRSKKALFGQELGIPIVTDESAEIEILHPTGKLNIVRMRLVEIFWEGEVAYLASLTDITDLKQAEESLKIHYRASEQSPASIIITDAEGDIEYVNTKFEQLTGYTASEVIGKNPRLLKSGQIAPEIYENLWQTITSGQEWHGEFLNQKKNGDLFWEQASISPIKNEEGHITHFVAVKEDITTRKENETLLSYQANYDALTGLPNRFLALDRLRQAIAQSQRNKKRVAVIFVDLDHFKDVNDTLGHEYGDQLLKLTAQRLIDCLRKSDTVARLGGDEFLIILPGLEKPNQCEPVAAKVLAALETAFDLSGEEAFISASIGITIYPDDGTDISMLMRNADTAMYRSKRSGRNAFKFYTASMNEEAQRRVSMENHLHHALLKQEFSVVYQPLIELATRQIVGAEALLRWDNPKFGRVEPSQFIPIAEDTGLINQLGAWILEKACHEVAIWHQSGFPLWVAVNLSPRQFRDAKFLKVITQAIQSNGIEAAYLELEITEALLVEDVPGAANLIEQLHQMNFRLVIDDFGTGYSALSYLKKFPFSTLKIDRSFISDLPYDSEIKALVKTIIAMAHGLGLKALAEGVESEEQLNFLIAQGCDYIQGYLFSPPLPSQAFLEYLRGKMKSLSI